MKYILTLFILASVTFPAFAQIRIDDGIRKPQAMVVGGSSVIDDEDESDTQSMSVGEGDDTVPIDSSGLSEEDQELLQDGLDDATVFKPITPESPSATPPAAQPGKNVKRVVKPYSTMKIRRSIQDDRIDDNYVQQMVKDNTMFTPSPAQ